MLKFLATTLVLASTTALAADNAAAVDKARMDLRYGCAQALASFSAHQPPDAEFRGDKHPGDAKSYTGARPCTNEQLAAYLDKADPALVMQAYPSAAGRPKAKKPVTSASAPGVQ